MKRSLLVALCGLICSIEAGQTIIFKNGIKTQGSDDTAPEYVSDKSNTPSNSSPQSSNIAEQSTTASAEEKTPPAATADGNALTQVADYVDLLEIHAMEKSNMVLLEVTGETKVDQGVDKAGFDQATLVTDLEDSMSHLTKDEKRVGKTIDTVFVSLSSRQLKPEAPPKELPVSLHEAFHRAAKAYELEFQKHFGEAHPGNINLLESTAVASTVEDPPAGGAAASQDTSFLDPYAFVTPATMQLGAVGYGAGAGGIASQQGQISAENFNLGVVSPPPPVRPDGLPPVPYIQPDEDDSEKGGEGKGKF